MVIVVAQVVRFGEFRLQMTTVQAFCIISMAALYYSTVSPGLARPVYLR
jgi:hypothetical protein